MNTKKQILSVVIGCSLMAAMAYAKDEKAVATVNGTPISQESLNAYLDVVNRSRPSKIDPATALDDLVVTELAIQQAKKDGYDQRDDVKKQIKEASKKILLTTWTREKSESMKVSDEEIKAAYDESMKGQATDEFKARHILVEKEDDAKALIKELADGGDFEKLAKEKSTGPSGPNGGDLGWFKPQTMVPPFAKAVESMKKGDVSKEPVKTSFGFHVIKLEDKRAAKLPGLDTVKPQLKRALVQEKMIAYIDSLKGSADVKINLPEPKAEEAEKKSADKAEK
ncbi:MAG: peptidylprolyl isomerase [Thiotrichaceae bacterium]